MHSKVQQIELCDHDLSVVDEYVRHEIFVSYVVVLEHALTLIVFSDDPCSMFFAVEEVSMSDLEAKG